MPLIPSRDCSPLGNFAGGTSTINSALAVCANDKTGNKKSSARMILNFEIFLIFGKNIAKTPD